MDEKHRMLYPPINASGAGSSTASPAASYAAVAAGPTAAEIKSATAEMGLPSEPPPTYDFAMSSTSSVPPIATISAAVAPSTSSDNANWRASAPVNLPTEVILHQPHAYEPTLPMIVEQPGQPRYQTQLPAQQQYQQQQPPQTQYNIQQQQPQYPQQQQQQQQQQKPLYPDQQQYQQQPQYQQQQQVQPQQQTVTLPTTIITPPPNLGPAPCKVTCPACGTNKTTRMCWTPNSRTHLCALLLCLVGWCCCACCVPYCMTSCRTGNHFCAKCNTFLGTYNPNQRK